MYTLVARRPSEGEFLLLSVAMVRQMEGCWWLKYRWEVFYAVTGQDGEGAIYVAFADPGFAG